MPPRLASSRRRTASLVRGGGARSELRVWRICSPKEARCGLAEMDAVEDGGRWNPPGVRMLYASTSRALALLEVMANAGPRLPRVHAVVEIRIPRGVRRAVAKPDVLPGGWCSPRAPRACREFGRAWTDAGRTAVLLVPSVLVPREHNVLVNPEHPDARRIRIVRVERIRLDVRLSRRAGRSTSPAAPAPRRASRPSSTRRRRARR
jgi:RES domain-containing protein